jgi:lipooligosaccharide transport system permease protein
MKRQNRLSKYFAMPELTYRVWKVWRRDFDVFMKTYKVNFFPPLLEPIFYLAALGFGLGGLVSSIGNLSYIQFITPALIAITIMNSSFFECTYGSFVRMYYQRTFDAIITTPISIEEVIAGEVLWGATRSLISSAIVLGVIAVFSTAANALGYSAAYDLITSPLAILVLVLAILSGLTFSTLAMCFTAIAPNIDFFNYPAFLLITPMFLLSGTFFPITVLPNFIQALAYAVLPLTHTVNLSRALFTGNLLQTTLVISIVWIAVVTPILFVLSINLMKNKLIK